MSGFSRFIVERTAKNLRKGDISFAHMDSGELLRPSRNRVIS